MSFITGFPPICGPASRVLILGSMPSARSLERGQYYGHPRNAFWPIMCEMLNGGYIESYRARTEMLTANHIALWDVCRCCERETSSDARIRDERPNAVAELMLRQGIKHVLFNGGAAATLFRRHIHMDMSGIDALRLPSTSPAYTLCYEAKKSAWRDALGACGIIAKLPINCKSEEV